LAFRLKTASCVATGTFNIYIVQPEWLTRAGILPRNTPITIDANLTRPGFRLRSPDLGSTWVVAPNRLVISTERRSEDCGALMAQVLRRLQWTPLSALGNNSIYEAPADEGVPVASRLIPGFEVLPPTSQTLDIEQRSLLLAIRRGERLINVQLELLQQVARIAVNVHTGLREQNDTAPAVAAATRFLADRAEAERIVSDILHLELSDDAGNA
jgi:hypothetical protein